MPTYITVITIIIITLAIQEVIGNPWMRCHLTDTGIQVILYGSQKGKEIPYSEIVEIRHATLWESLIGRLTWTVDRFSKPAIAIIWKHAGLNKYVMSPKNADEFIAQVKEEMAKA